MMPAQFILTASLAALGPPQAPRQLQTLSAFARCSSPRGEYTTQIHSGRGGRVWFQQTFPNRDSFRIVINSNGAWATNTITGETSTLDAPTISMIRGHEFQMLPLTLTDRFKNLMADHETEFNGTRCFTLRALDDLDAPCAHYFRARDFRWTGMVLANSHRRDETIRVVVNRWTCAGDLWLPSHVTATDSSGDYILDFIRITLNDVPEQIFDNPTPVIPSARTLA